jgi:hypothetical protein
VQYRTGQRGQRLAVAAQRTGQLVGRVVGQLRGLGQRVGEVSPVPHVGHQDQPGDLRFDHPQAGAQRAA